MTCHKRAFSDAHKGSHLSYRSKSETQRKGQLVCLNSKGIHYLQNVCDSPNEKT